MRRLAVAAAVVVASASWAACEDSASADPFCDAVRDFSVQAASMFTLIGSDNPGADLQAKRAKAKSVLDRMDEAAPDEIDSDVRQLTDGWRAVLDGRLRAVPPERGQAVMAWTTKNCGEGANVGTPGWSPYPAPTAPPAPPAP